MLVCWWQILSVLGWLTKYLAFIFKVFLPLAIELFAAYIISDKKSVFLFLYSLICKMSFFFLWLHLGFYSLLLVSSTLIIMCLMWFSLCLYCLGFVEFFWICEFMLSSNRKNFQPLFLPIFSLNLYSGTQITYMLDHLIFTHMSLRLWSSLPHFSIFFVLWFG